MPASDKNLGNRYFLLLIFFVLTWTLWLVYVDSIGVVIKWQKTVRYLVQCI